MDLKLRIIWLKNDENTLSISTKSLKENSCLKTWRIFMIKNHQFKTQIIQVVEIILTRRANKIKKMTRKILLNRTKKTNKR